MRSGSEPTLWSSCFFFLYIYIFLKAQCLKEATMSVITKRFSKDQLDMAKASPEITNTRCFLVIDRCSAAL